MLFVLSPAKSLDYLAPAPELQPTIPPFTDRAADLISVLRDLSPSEIGSLMGISDALAQLNAGRFASWSKRPGTDNARPAVFAFDGDVYDGLGARNLDGKPMQYMQQHLRILSGLYGLLRPSDWLQPYRLEMGTRLATPQGQSLYDFWGDEITLALKAELAGCAEPVLVNLASEEYFKVVQPRILQCRVVTPVFEDWKGGRFKIISFHAKRARGLMARFAAAEGIADAERLKEFDVEGYAFAPRQSTGARWVFRRRLED